MNEPDRQSLDLLFSGYADDALTAEESAALCTALREDDASVDHFVRNCFLHWQLFELARQTSLRSDVMQRPEISVSDLAAPATTRTRSLRAALKYFAIAACLTGVAVAGWMLLSAPIVAQVSELSANAVWSGDEHGPVAGDLLKQGRELTLKRGRLVTTLLSGAKLVVEAPATLTLTERNSISVASGRITAIIPRQATGFRIDTALGHFVDLGTEFTLDLTKPRSFRLVVFRGLVEFRPGRGAKGGLLRTPQGRAVAYDAKTGDVEVLPYDEQERMSL